MRSPTLRSFLTPPPLRGPKMPRQAEGLGAFEPLRGSAPCPAWPLKHAAYQKPAPSSGYFCAFGAVYQPKGEFPPMTPRSEGKGCSETLPKRTLLYYLKLGAEFVSIRLGFHQQPLQGLYPLAHGLLCLCSSCGPALA